MEKKKEILELGISEMFTLCADN